MTTGTLQHELDAAGIHHSGVGTGTVLIISSWAGVFIGAVLTLLTTGPFGAAGAVGWLVNGLWAAPAFGLLFGAIGLASSRDNVLRATGSRPVDDNHPLSVMVGRLATRLNLPKPVVATYPDRDMNAFACGSGPSSAAVSFTQGIVEGMPDDELEAVAAHELGHIVSNDMRRMQFAVSFQRSLTWYLGFTERGQSFARWALGPS